MAHRTPLYDWHKSHGARMVDFAGWDMPVLYSNITDEHNAVRNKAGLFDISHMGRLSFGGADALDLIQYVFTNNAATMNDNQVRYGLICNDEGGILDDVLIYRWPYGFAMVVNASNRERIVAWLHDSTGGRDVQMQDQTMDTCMIAVQGPKSVEMATGLTDADPSALKYYYATPTRFRDTACVMSRTGYTGEDGFEFMVKADLGATLWEELIGRGAKACGLGSRDTLRLEAAMPLYGHELSEDIDPFAADLAWAVKLKKGDFRGRDAMAKRKEVVTRRRVGLTLDGKRIAREGAKVLNGDVEVGEATSGTFSPTLGKSIAMAYLEPAHAEPGTELTIDIRGTKAIGRVTPLPFYKR